MVAACQTAPPAGSGPSEASATAAAATPPSSSPPAASATPPQAQHRPCTGRPRHGRAGLAAAPPRPRVLATDNRQRLRRPDRARCHGLSEATGLIRDGVAGPVRQTKLSEASRTRPRSAARQPDRSRPQSPAGARRRQRSAAMGCIRVTNSTMDWLWSSGATPIGTQVWVY